MLVLDTNKISIDRATKIYKNTNQFKVIYF